MPTGLTSQIIRDTTAKLNLINDPTPGASVSSGTGAPANRSWPRRNPLRLADWHALRRRLPVRALRLGCYRGPSARPGSFLGHLRRRGPLPGHQRRERGIVDDCWGCAQRAYQGQLRLDSSARQGHVQDAYRVVPSRRRWTGVLRSLRWCRRRRSDRGQRWSFAASRAYERADSDQHCERAACVHWHIRGVAYGCCSEHRQHSLHAVAAVAHNP